MATPKWLLALIHDHYLPAIRELPDTAKGRRQARLWADWMKRQWAEHGLPTLKQQRNLMTAVRNAIKDTLGEDHFALESMNFTTAEWIEMNNGISARVAERNENQQFLENPDAIVAKAVRLLESREWADVAAGLTVLTGRRSSEILSTAQFEPHPTNRWSVIFTGALKRRKETQILSFEIPTLTTAERVCQALAQLRSWIKTEGMTAEQLNAKYSEAVAKSCDRHFTDLVPRREGRDNLYTHLFRSIYATIATYWYCPPRVSEIEFKAQIQGHFAVLDEQNPDLRRSLAANRHYSDYLISDGKGNVDGRKGIKLGYGGIKPIEVFAGSWQQPQQETREPVELQEPMLDSSDGEQLKRQRTSVGIWLTDRALLESIFDRLGLDPDDTQINRMSALLQWVDQRLEQESEQQPAPEQEPAPAIAQTPPSAAKPEVPPVISKTEEAAVSSGLEAKLDRLAEVMTLFVESQLNQVSTKAQIARQPHPEATVTPTQLSKPSEPRPKRERSTQGADSKVNRAIDKLIEYNNQPGLLHTEKWAIGISVLKRLTGCYQGVISRVLEDRKEELDQHHRQHGLGVTHNNYHRGKLQVTDVIQL